MLKKPVNMLPCR